MARKKIGKKEKHHVELDPSKDEFIETSMSFVDWLVERRKIVGLLLGTGLAVWVAILVVDAISTSANEASSKLLATGLDTALAPVGKKDEVYRSPKAGDISFESIAARTEQAVKDYDNAIADSKGSKAEAVAIMLKASAYADSGDFEKSVALYKESLAKKDIAPLTDTIRMNMGVALEALGKDKEALSVYDSVIKNAGSDSRMALWAKYSSARILEKQSSKEKAEKMLQGVVDAVAAQGEPDKNDYLLVQARTRLLGINPDAKVPELPSGLNPQILQQLLQAQQGAGGALQ